MSSNTAGESCEERIPIATLLTAEQWVRVYTRYCLGDASGHFVQLQKDAPHGFFGVPLLVRLSAKRTRAAFVGSEAKCHVYLPKL